MTKQQSRRFVGGILALIIICSSFSFATHPASAASQTGVMVALYTYPGTTWDAVAQAKIAHPSVPIVAIINPNNGPGSSRDANYVSGIQELHAAGVVVLGYDATGYASNSASSVKSVMDTWKSLYSIDGIFFDEMANWSGPESYYSGLTSYAKSLGYTMTVGNPGTDTLPSYIGTVDNLMIYENPGLPSLSALQGWHTGYDKSNFSMIAFGVSSLSTSFLTSASNYAGYIYITNDNLPNPYDTIPPYFGTLVADLDTGSSTTTAPQPPTNLSATATSSSQINLSWTAPSNNGGSAITGYEIDRSTNSGSTWSTLVANTGSTGTTHSDTGLAPSTTYTYRVSTINGIGTSSVSNTTSATTNANTTNGIVLSNTKSISGTVSSSNQITLSNFNVGTGSNHVLVVGVSANNIDVSSITFGGISLKNTAYSFYNNDAELWYLKNPSGTGNVVVTMNGPTQIVVGAYTFSGVNQTTPILTHVAKHNTNANSPKISITTKYSNDWVLDLPSIYGGSTLSSPTCTQHWDIHMTNQITGASSSTIVQIPGTTTCGWTASNGGELWDDVAVELNAAR